MAAIKQFDTREEAETYCKANYGELALINCEVQIMQCPSDEMHYFFKC